MDKKTQTNQTHIHERSSDYLYGNSTTQNATEKITKEVGCKNSHIIITMENKNQTMTKIGDENPVNRTSTACENKCKFCNRVIGDAISDYHIGCYKQKQLLDIKQLEEDN